MSILKTEKSMAIRQCDECGQVQTVRLSALLSSRKKRESDIDRCWNCSCKHRKPLLKGKRHGNWKHGLSKAGYKRITTSDGRRIYEHQAVIENKLHRRLFPGECIHHIDLEKTNNSENNLYVFDCETKHRFCHKSLEECTLSFLEKLIWFDPNTNRYTLTKQLKIINETIIPPPSTLYKSCDKRNKRAVYLFFSVKLDNGMWGQKMYHVYVAEKMLGRKTFHTEQVHHINGNTLDNRPSNLCVMESSEHHKCHFSIEECGITLYKNGKIQFRDGKYYIT